MRKLLFVVITLLMVSSVSAYVYNSPGRLSPTHMFYTEPSVDYNHPQSGKYYSTNLHTNKPAGKYTRSRITSYVTGALGTYVDEEDYQKIFDVEERATRGFTFNKSPFTAIRNFFRYGRK